MNRQVILLILSVFAINACKDPFSPEVEAQYKNLLVVEGFINVGGETTIQISRSADLQDWQSLIPEKEAQVIIEGEKGTVLSGTSDINGKCVLSTASLNLSERYRLKIVSKGKTYQTAYLENKKSPEIDSLNFRVEDKGFKIYVNTHDKAGETRYYNWYFTETWEIRSAFPSAFEYKNGRVIERDPNINIQYCWAQNRSSKIILASSERLSEDRLSMVPIHHVLGNSAKVAYMYSILVTQYGLTSEAYHYLENIKKNTEQIGSIFDAQPSELKGNVVCVSNPQEMVLGWISAGTTTQKRLFISYKDKPANGGTDWMFYQPCEPFTTSKDSLLYYLAGRNLIISESYGTKPLPDGSTVGIFLYSMARDECIDCRLRGSNVKPGYWPN